MRKNCYNVGKPIKEYELQFLSCCERKRSLFNSFTTNTLSAVEHHTKDTNKNVVK